MSKFMDYFQRLRQFVLALSGAHTETLKLVPTERTRFESLGWAILITSGLAVVSMWFALANAMGVNGILAVPVALFWGLVIMGIDRWLVTSMPVDSSRKLALAAPRVILAVLLGTLISTPLVLRIFSTEINAQIATMQQNNYNNFLKQQEGSQVAKQVTTYRNELNYLNSIINSHGASNGNSAGDPELVSYNTQLASLQKQLTTWTQAKTQDLKEYSCQKYGGADCPKAGVGPAAKASLAGYNQASAQVVKIQGEINQVQGNIRARTKQLSSNDKVDELNRYQEALTQRPLVQSEYNTAVQRQNQLQQTYYAQNQASHGILMKLEALSQLSNGNLTVAVARGLLFLLFLVIECLPVTVKLLQRPGQYEAALARARVAEDRDVEMYYSSWSGLRVEAPAVAAAPEAGTRRTPGERHAEPDRSADVFAIWNPTKVMPRVVGHPADDESTEVLDQQAPAEGAWEYPPAESDLRSGHGWGRRAGRARREDDESRPEGDRQRDGASRDRSRSREADWDAPTQDVGGPPTEQDMPVGATRRDFDYSDAFASEDAYPPEYGRHEEAPYGEESSQSLHDALSSMGDQEDAPSSGRPEGSGMPLNWDEE